MGPELVTNNDFASNAAGWELDAGGFGGVTWVGGQLQVDFNVVEGEYNSSIVQDFGLTLPNGDYQVQITVSIPNGIDGNLTGSFDIDTPVLVAGIGTDFGNNFYLGVQIQENVNGGVMTTYTSQVTYNNDPDDNGFTIDIEGNNDQGPIFIESVSLKAVAETVAGDLPTRAASIVSAVTKVQQNTPFPKYVIGGQNATTFRLFKHSSSHVFHVWRSPVYKIGKNFDVLKIKFSVVGGVATNQTIIPVLYFDHAFTSSVGTTVNATNYANADQLITLSSQNFSNAVHGRNNFFLELQFSGSTLAVVKLPIEIELEVED